jgi:hypothetical protein
MVISLRLKLILLFISVRQALLPLLLEMLSVTCVHAFYVCVAQNPAGCVTSPHVCVWSDVMSVLQSRAVRCPCKVSDTFKGRW